MMRSPIVWAKIFADCEFRRSHMAERILSDLVGYRKTSLKRADDATTLAYAIDAIYQTGFNAGYEAAKKENVT